MAAAVNFACTCGEVQGQLSAVTVQNGLRIVCFCKSCRAAEVHAGQPDPAPEPVDIFQVPSNRVEITKGREKLTPFKLSPKGVLRWQASCCGALVGNTPEDPKLSVFGLCTARVSDPETLGPVRSRAFVPQANGKTKHEGVVALATRTIWNMIANRITGKWRDTQFFADQLPIQTPRTLSKEEKDALMQRLGSQAN